MCHEDEVRVVVVMVGVTVAMPSLVVVNDVGWFSIATLNAQDSERFRQQELTTACTKVSRHLDFNRQLDSTPPLILLPFLSPPLHRYHPLTLPTLSTLLPILNRPIPSPSHLFHPR